MANDLGAIDTSKPDGATQEVRILDNYQRETRDVLVGWAGIEHDLKGRHKYAIGNTASRPLTSGSSPAVTGTLYINTETGTLEYYDGTTWRPVVSSVINYVYNGDMELFDSKGDVFVGWTRTGAGSTNARNATNIKEGLAAMDVTRVGNDVTVEQNVAAVWHGATWWRNKIVTLGCWVRNSGAATAKIAINDGVGTTTSAAQALGSTYEWMQVTRVIDAAATSLKVRLLVQTADGTSQFDGVRLSLGYKLDDFVPDSYPRQSFFATCGDTATVNQGTTAYGSLGTGWSTIGNEPPISCVAKCIVKGIYLRTSVATTWIVQLRKNGSGAGMDLSCSTLGSQEASDFDPTHWAAFIAGDEMTVQLDSITGTARASVMLLIELTPAGI